MWRYCWLLSSLIRTNFRVANIFTKFTLVGFKIPTNTSTCNTILADAILSYQADPQEKLMYAVTEGGLESGQEDMSDFQSDVQSK